MLIDPPPVQETNGCAVLSGCSSGDLHGAAAGEYLPVDGFGVGDDHHRSTRTVEGTNNEARRLESIWMGKAAAMKRQALLAIAGASQLRLAA